MGIFSKMYSKVLQWSEHKHAPYYLGGISFIESSVFPIPPDVMLISMGLVKPQQAWRYALIATIFSVLGGMFGYLIGEYFLQLIFPYIQYLGYASAYAVVAEWFKHWGILAVFLAGFTPIPYKLFTIGAGAMHMLFWPFVVASIVGRGMRFFLVSAAMFSGGARIQKILHRYIDIIGWILVAILIVIFCGYQITKFFHGGGLQ